MLELNQATINTILLLLVTALVGTVGRIFWSGIKNVMDELKLMKEDMGDVKLGVKQIDTWKDGKDKLDTMLQTHNVEEFKRIRDELKRKVNRPE